jgi:uncharacterized protein CbrC (UPF0167 family)
MELLLVLLDADVDDWVVSRINTYRGWVSAWWPHWCEGHRRKSGSIRQCNVLQNSLMFQNTQAQLQSGLSRHAGAETQRVVYCFLEEGVASSAVKLL